MVESYRFFNTISDPPVPIIWSNIELSIRVKLPLGLYLVELESLMLKSVVFPLKSTI